MCGDGKFLRRCHLNTAVGEVDAVFALNVAAGVLGLGLVEVGAGVAVLNSVLPSKFQNVFTPSLDKLDRSSQTIFHMSV